MTDKKTSYKGYDLFNDLEDDLLQAWNRANVIANINEDLDAKAAQAYVDHFTPVEKMKVEMLLAMVSHSGIEEVKKRIMQTPPLEAT